MNLSIDLQKRLSPNFALEVKFSIPAGITMLFGASGSGKTTLLRCIAGLLRPESAQITIGDEILFDSKARLDIPVRERRIGFLFQNLALFPHLTVMKNIEYGLDGLSRTDAQQRIENVVKMFSISCLRNNKPKDLFCVERLT